MRVAAIFSRLVAAFNLEQSNVINGGVLLGSKGYFGASLELHQSQSEWTLLIGAPTDSSEGSLYKCPLNAYGTEPDCQKVDVSSCVESRNRQIAKQGQNVDYYWSFNETGKMFGYTISSAGPDGDVAVCSPRLWLEKNNKKINTQVGECMILDSSLRIKNDPECSFNPCLDKTTLSSTSDPSLKNYLFCNAGFTAAWSPQTIGDDALTALYMGLPNMLQYAGNIVSALPVNTLDNVFMDKFMTFDVDLPNPYTWIYEPLIEEDFINKPDKGLFSNSYLGTSLKAANLSSTTPGITIISGGDHLNEVNLYTIGSDGKKFNLQSTIVPPGKSRDGVRGIADISGFGRVVETIDLDGDGELDIIIGAPLHVYINQTDKLRSTEGQVLIYLSRDNPKWSSKSNLDGGKFIKLEGAYASRFGQSIRNVGDINHDGIDDLAIAAPGENKVYIFHGNRTFTDEAEPVQVLEVAENVLGFGYSITAADFDGNGYSDVIVGSLSENVFLFKSRPIIDVRSTLKPNKKSLKLDENERSVSIDFCFSFNERSNTMKENIMINFNITLDGMRRGRPRVSFVRDEDQTVFSDDISLELGLEECVRDVKFYLRKQGQYDDKLSPIDVRLTWDLSSRRSRRAESADLVPILDSLDGSSQTIQIEVENNCGPDLICKSNLQSSAEFQMGVKDLNGTFEWTSSEKKLNRKQKRSLTTFTLGKEELIGFLVTSRNNKDDAHEASFTVRYPKHVLYTGYEKIDEDSTNVKCFKEESDNALRNRDLYTSLRCVLGNPFKHNDKAQVRLRFQKQPTIVSQDEISFYLSKNTTSQQKDDGETDYIMRIKLDPMLKIETSTVNSGQFSYRLIPKDQQLNIDEIKETKESLPDKALLIGPKVEHRYSVYTESSLAIPKVTLEFHWPTEEFHSGGFLLYLWDIKIDNNGNDIECENLDSKDPQNIRNGIRKRRENEIKNSENNPKRRGTQWMGMSDFQRYSCGNQKMKCETITCVISDLRRGENIVFDFVAYAYRPTFSEFLNRITPIDKVVIESDVTVDFASEGDENTAFKAANVETANSDMTATVRVTGNSEKASPSIFTVPLWVIVVAAAGGVLILIIITVILWKLGCFQRGEYKYQPEMHRAERKVQRSKEVAENDIYSYDRNVMLLSDQD